MINGDSAAHKREYNGISKSSVGELVASYFIHQSKRARRPSLKIMNIGIDDLPDAVLVEILCRLPGYKFVCQCKCVSKRWCTLMFGPSFIGRFLCLQSDHNQTPTMRTVINRSGFEFLTRISLSAYPLNPLFKRLMSFHCLKEEPVVVSTYNDLVLCCASMCEQRDYYICNPCTLQWVALPPPPQVDQIVPIGFICDHPYYNCKKDDQGGHIIQLNAEYRCKVMRLIFPYGQECACKKFKVQIFSSETGEWRESNVSSPSDINFYVINYEANFIYNGMLFWSGAGCGPCGNFLIGLDPFMIDSSCGSNGDDYYECRFIELELDRPFMFECLGTYRGCLRMCDYNSATRVLSVRDLNEEEILFHGGTVKLGMENMKVYSLDKEMMPDDDPTGNLMLGFDPYDDDILYLERGGDSDIVKCDIHTREWSKIAENRRMESCVYFPFVVPWWPTPVPRPPQHRHNTTSSLAAFNLQVCCKVHSIAAADEDKAKESSDVIH